MVAVIPFFNLCYCLSRVQLLVDSSIMKDDCEFSQDVFSNLAHCGRDSKKKTLKHDLHKVNTF